MSAALGPVSQALEAEVRERVRQQGIVVWLDAGAHYTGFVDRLAELRRDGKLPYDVRAYRHSHLELMLGLEELAAGTDKAPLVVHLPGFNEDTVKSTPLLELYATGVRFRRALETLVTEAAAGRVPPAEIEAFCTRGELSLHGADTWLSARLDDRSGGFAAQLQGMSLPAIIDDLLAGGHIADRVRASSDRETLWQHLAAAAGLAAAWRGTWQAGGAERAEDVAFTLASWALAVEYTDDLARAPVSPQLGVMRDLPRPVIGACRELAEHLRQSRSDFYRRSADTTESVLHEEIDAARAEDLGKIDTFRFEEERILKEALAALSDERWDRAAGWAAVRLSGGSFWLRDDPARRSAWELLEAAARLGAAVAASGEPFGGVGSVDEALEAYVVRGAPVDRAHRLLEQRRATLLYPQLPEFETLRSRLDAMRRLWRRWANGWARSFNALCTRHGFLPSPQLQQRTLFDQVVRPLCQEHGPTALFLVDALRFEMGQELYEALEKTSATKVVLEARLAELPTVTQIGMNALAPVADRGTLRPAVSGSGIDGFGTGEFRVCDPKTRKRAMHDRIGGDTCPWLTLEEVLSRESTSLKQAVARARLVVVHSQEIDNAGEKGVGPTVFEHALRRLRAAWGLLREAGVRRFVFTADHGFLLLDETAETAQAHGRKIDPKRRHVFSSVAADHRGEVRVSLRHLGYEGAEGHLMFPETTAVFDTGQRGMSFVHGGNSLQERVIPVLTLVHRAAAGADTVEYTLTATAAPPVGGMHVIEATLGVMMRGELGFGTQPEVEIALRAPAEPEVQVELCQARGARVVSGAILARVGEPFAMLFRLRGPSAARVLVELYHPGATLRVAPCRVEQRFEISAAGTRALVTEEQPPSAERAWLQSLPDDGARHVFEHLEKHGTLTEPEATGLLGSPRAARRFALRFDEYAEKLPFAVRIEVVAGVKRYVREGARR